MNNRKLRSSYNILMAWWRGIDQQLIIALGILFLFSLMLVTTASPSVAVRIGLDYSYFTVRQVVYLAIAILIILLLSAFNKVWIRRICFLGFIINLILLFMVKFYGYEAKGAKRWISILGFSLQPSEFIKPFFSVVTAWILSLKSKENNFPAFSIVFFLYLVVAFSIILQPDLGMLVAITGVWGIQLFVAGMPFLWIVICIFMFISGISGAYFLLPHVAKRINSFLDPENNENYQVSKSLLAFENGGLYGKGPGEGTVKQIIPDSHADFIFAVAGEEFGAIACIIIAGVFAFIVIRALIKASNENDYFVMFTVVGIASQFAIQSIINMGVTLNLLPTKGMTLPFISYGGSSTIAISISMGILVAFTKRVANLRKFRVNTNDIIY